MSINGVGSYHVQDYVIRNKSRSVGRDSSIYDEELIGSATSLSESSENGKKIGVTAVGNKGYIAMYADSSTEQDPIVKVGDYEVRVKDVNPNSATKIEMFALMSYMDDKGLTNNQGMSSFSKLTAYASQAEYNGYCSGISDENTAWTVERDWIEILKNAKETFFSNPQMYGQGLECEKIIGNLRNWKEAPLNSVKGNIRQNTKQIPIEGGEELTDISDKEYIELIRKQIEEMQEKLDNGEVNESFQIGAQTYTLEEWQEFLDKFDSIQEIIRELMRERHDRLEKEKLNKKEEEKIEEIAAEMIVSESTSCTYPASDANKEEIRYITCYTKEGIFCKKAGLLDGYEWTISFENKEEYNKVMEFIGQFPKDCDWRFASQEGFWKDFLDNEIDVESFMDSIKNS